MTPQSSMDEVLTRLAREHSGQVLASLARWFNDLDLADEAVQEALIEASQRWSGTGDVPENLGGWLYRVAQRKALDRLRRAASEQRRIDASAPELVAQHSSNDFPSAASMLIEKPEAGHPVADERLRLVLLCCHPALNGDAQVALTLRLVGGLTTEEIAAAFLVPTPTLAARITRAKKKIRQANIPLNLPAEIGDRIDAVLATLYLVFNEGYLSRSSAAAPMRVDLCKEAIRLTDVVARLAPGHAEARGLAALLRLSHARRDARFAGDELIPLDEQDRSVWRLDEIQAANRFVGATLQLMQPGPYQLQALIASQHCNARTAADTDWARIAALYDQLFAMQATPVVGLNRAVALAMADGPLAGLKALDLLEGLDGYHLLHATRGELLARSGDAAGARASFGRARALASNPSEIAHIETKLAGLG